MEPAAMAPIVDPQSPTSTDKIRLVGAALTRQKVHLASGTARGAAQAPADYRRRDNSRDRVEHNVVRPGKRAG